jgi:hypothetical protein
MAAAFGARVDQQRGFAAAAPRAVVVRVKRFAGNDPVEVDTIGFADRDPAPLGAATTITVINSGSAPQWYLVCGSIGSQPQAKADNGFSSFLRSTSSQW